MEHVKDCMKPISMVEFANALLAPPRLSPVQAADHAALRAFVDNDLNDACNRRAQLALVTVEAMLVCRQRAIKDEEPHNENQKVARFAKHVLIDDLLEEVRAIKRGF